MDFSNLSQQIRKHKIKWIRLCFCNPFGLLHQLSIPVHEMTKEALVDGFPLDGSSILGFSNIETSDIILVPDLDTFAVLPDFFDVDHREQGQYISKTARIFAAIHQGFGEGQLFQDSRHIAQKAEMHAKKVGYDKTYWAAELEFFIFDEVNTSKETNNIISKEAPWVSNNPNKINFKRGYYSDSPSDTLVNFRDEVCDILHENFKIKTIAHHHEVATAGQSEIVLKHSGLVDMADSFVTGIKTIQEVATKRNKVASFDPKPIPKDNGSAVHINQSMWKTKNKKASNIFYNESEKYAELSQTAYYYIGGLLEHAKALCAITNPTEQSYKRLVPGFEAPTNIAWGKMNRTVSVRIPAHNKKKPESKRIEYRPPDPTSNIYLVETALLLAGLDGIKNKTQPPDPVDLNTYKLSDREMKKYSVLKLPTSLQESIDSFESDKDFLKPVFEKSFLEMYIDNIK